MIIEMPAGLTAERLPEFILPGELELAERDVDTFTYRWRWKDTIELVHFDFVNHKVIIDETTAPAAMVEELRTRLAGFGGPAAWDPAARQIFGLAQSAVGVDIRQLSDAQRWALLALLLWNKHALGNDLAVRPLREWIGRQPR